MDAAVASWASTRVGSHTVNARPTMLTRQSETIVNVAAIGEGIIALGAGTREARDPIRTVANAARVRRAFVNLRLTLGSCEARSAGA